MTIEVGGGKFMDKKSRWLSYNGLIWKYKNACGKLTPPISWPLAVRSVTKKVYKSWTVVAVFTLFLRWASGCQLRIRGRTSKKKRRHEYSNMGIVQYYAGIIICVVVLLYRLITCIHPFARLDFFVEVVAVCCYRGIFKENEINSHVKL